MEEFLVTSKISTIFFFNYFTVFADNDRNAWKDFTLKTRKLRINRAFESLPSGMLSYNHEKFMNIICNIL